MSKKFIILSIDGGGLRGIVPIKILQHIELLTGKKIIDCFDFFAGTSTGGLITCGITLSGPGASNTLYSLDDIEEVYCNNGETIFPNRGKVSKFFHYWVKGLFRPEFNSNGIDLVISTLFNNLSHLSGADSRVMHCVKPIFVTSYDIKGNKPLFFKSRHANTYHKENIRLYDVCRATSAGPTYLPAHSFPFDDNQVTSVDGGVFMNNPSLGALIEIMKYKTNSYYNMPNLNTDDIFLLSIGTGHNMKEPIESSKAINKGGKKNWITAITDVMMYGTNQAVDYQTKELLHFPLLNKENYLRIQINIDDAYAKMTDSSITTREYLTKQVKDQFVNNSTLQNELNKFIVNSGL